MTVQFQWLPETVNSNWFRWKVALTNGTATTQWSPTNAATFVTNPVSIVWTNLANGESNREFLVDAWFDLNTNGTQEAWETHRQLFVTVVTAEVTNIKFNHNTGASTNDAVNIRQDFLTPYDISNGEWVNGGTNVPACYTTNRTATIKARLTILPTNITQAAMWAVSTDTGGSLGDLVKTNVTFVSGIASDVVFEVSGTTPSCIQKTTNDVWQWKMEKVAGSGSPTSGISIKWAGGTPESVTPLRSWTTTLIPRKGPAMPIMLRNFPSAT